MLPRGYLIGNLTADPAGGSTKQGKPFSRFAVACNEEFSNSHSKPKGHFYNCIAFGPRADYINKYIAKGDTVFIEYTLRTNNYTTDDGKVNRSMELLLNKISILKRIIDRNITGLLIKDGVPKTLEHLNLDPNHEPVYEPINELMQPSSPSDQENNSQQTAPSLDDIYNKIN